MDDNDNEVLEIYVSTILARFELYFDVVAMKRGGGK